MASKSEIPGAAGSRYSDYSILVGKDGCPQVKLDRAFSDISSALSDHTISPHLSIGPNFFVNPEMPMNAGNLADYIGALKQYKTYNVPKTQEERRSFRGGSKEEAEGDLALLKHAQQALLEATQAAKAKAEAEKKPFACTVPSV